MMYHVLEFKGMKKDNLSSNLAEEYNARMLFSMQY